MDIKEAISIRRDLHRIPEVGFKEYKTQKYIIEFLKNIGWKDFSVCSKTGVIAFLPGKENETIAFRADIDGLEIEEKNHSFSSEHKGFMHACGHDGHTAILLMFAKTILNMKFKKNILLIFQPAEEGPGGAKIICESGILEKYSVKEIYGLHLFPELEEGVISTKPGPFFAQATEFDCKIIGKGGHGGIPQNTIDPLIPFIKTIDSYQTIVSRNLSPFSPAVITIGKFLGGSVRNIISNSAEFYGTIRAYSQKDTDFIIKRMKEINNGIEIAFNVKFESEFRTLYPPVINDEKLYKKFLRLSLPNFKLGKELATAEDFSFYQEKIPGVFFLLGTRNENLGFTAPLHNCNFNFNEAVLLKGVELFLSLIKEYKI